LYSAVKFISIPGSDSEFRALRSDLGDDTAKRYFQAFVDDLMQEINLLDSLKGNDNIVTLQDFAVKEQAGEVGWDILMRMELLTTLNEFTSTNALSEDVIAKLGTHMCHALELCYASGIIHRDIKPDNIFASNYGTFKLGDFGAARCADRALMVLSKKGTNNYMAPEVFKGEKYGHSVDIYSLGIVMYKFLNHNRIPFLPNPPDPVTPRDFEYALHKRMRGDPLPPIAHVNPTLQWIVLKACAFNHEDRFSNPTEMRIALESLYLPTEESSQFQEPPQYDTRAYMPNAEFNEAENEPKGVNVLLIILGFIFIIIIILFVTRQFDILSYINFGA
jgi:serine/threonine-protein kinase